MLVAAAGCFAANTTTRVYDEMRLEDFQALNFTQKLDHFNFFEKRNFTQRYWVNDKYWDNKTGPIFLYICGEATCRPPTERGYAFQIC
jgi:Serine carboxypeptidase S28